MGSFSGHFWTLMPVLRERLRPRSVPPWTPWETHLSDPRVGPVRLAGELREVPGADTVIVFVHGLGGRCDRPYCREAAVAATGRGWSSLSLGLRGTDGSGEDLYHSGLTDDLHAALRAPELARYRNVLVLGFSMGGHITLRAAAEVTEPGAPTIDPRLRAIAAVCSPVHLPAAQRHIDGRQAALYRRSILAELVRGYTRVAERWGAGGERAPSPVERVSHVRSFREFDELTVVPRFGFRSPDDYYTRATAAPLLHRLETPALLVSVTCDPLVPEHTVRPHLPDGALEVRWSKRGGHLGFPSNLDLGLGPARGLLPQVMQWLAARLD